jgi:hypothetical protein
MSHVALLGCCISVRAKSREDTKVTLGLKSNLRAYRAFVACS